MRTADGCVVIRPEPMTIVTGAWMCVVGLTGLALMRTQGAPLPPLMIWVVFCIFCGIRTMRLAVIIKRDTIVVRNLWRSYRLVVKDVHSAALEKRQVEFSMGREYWSGVLQMNDGTRVRIDTTRYVKSVIFDAFKMFGDKDTMESKVEKIRIALDLAAQQSP